MKRYSQSKHGFTIIEMIATISIISILSSVIVPLYIRYVEKAKQAKAVSIGQSICCAALWSCKEQRNGVSLIKIKDDIEEITAFPIHLVAVNSSNSILEIYFSSDNKNYTGEVDTGMYSYKIRERGKGTVIYE